MVKLKKFLNITATIALVIVTVMVIIVFIQRISGHTPKVFGYQLYNVATDSMTPQLKVGDVIVVKECNPAELHKGDIISYHGESGQLAGKDITHRVSKEPVISSNGTVSLQTQGIKTGAMPDPPITGDQVIGKYVTKLVIMSFIYGIFKKWYGLLIFVLILLLLMGKEVYNLHRIMDSAQQQADILTARAEIEAQENKEDKDGKSDEKKQ